MTWVGPWQTTDSMEKQLLHGFPPFPSPAPQTGICSFCATLPESTAAGSTCRPISSGWDSVRGEWERGRGIQSTPRHPWRLSEGQDGWRPSLTSQPHSGLDVQSRLGRNKQRRNTKRTKLLLEQMEEGCHEIKEMLEGVSRMLAAQWGKLMEEKIRNR